MAPLALSAMTAVSAMGQGLAAMRLALKTRHCPLRPCDFPHIELPTWIGRVEGVEEASLPASLAAFDCRNNRLVLMALESDDFMHDVATAVRRYGPTRIGVVLGTSTSGIEEGEHAYRQRDPATGHLPGHFDFVRTQDLFAATRFVRTILGLRGPGFAVSNACASSAKAFADAAMLIETGLCDAVVVGGADSLCGITLHGFNSLDLLAPGPCRPFAADRDGLSIGEGAAFALLERQSHAENGQVSLLGHGASTDAHHMSSPHPDGAGAILAIRQALALADLSPETIDYVNFHGTGTLGNDAVEDKAVFATLGGQTPCSSTKGWTGHTLGASGAMEALITSLSLIEGLVPGCLNVAEVDPLCRSRVVTANLARPLKIALSNSFGFGGSNCSLVLGRAA
ncbi:beta-ketoacyl-[acyl-carrier-protein] synthase family protein [Arboricoccus pini]|nr:beta-ketoacyl-[acyl-carrier-protein] synthase family protein [Arboricoccus pini]